MRKILFVTFLVILGACSSVPRKADTESVRTSAKVGEKFGPIVIEQRLRWAIISNEK
jgi:starvation-inducible outer membrane lipoprotein